MEPVIVLHGGAGDIPDSRVPLKLSGIQAATRAGYAVLQDLSAKNDPAASVKAVVAAVSVMEDLEAFNAGYGSVLTEDGTIEMDASVVDGASLRYGAVAALANFANPIQVAEAVLSESKHCLFAGEGAARFAQRQGFKPVDLAELVSPYATKALQNYKENSAVNELGHDEIENVRGTVGAVAIDSKGNLAAATSTGGITGKQVGRVGDTPILGAGVFADNASAGVSTTGVGECLLRALVAKRAADNVASGTDPTKAMEAALAYMSEKVGGDGGGICISANGQVGVAWNSRRMAWAYAQSGRLHSGCNKDEHFEEDV